MILRRILEKGDTWLRKHIYFPTDDYWGRGAVLGIHHFSLRTLFAAAKMPDTVQDQRAVTKVCHFSNGVHGLKLW